MGRTDAVQFTLEWAAEARRLGAIVEFEPGWETRGNGMTANYEGLELHHTAFLSSEANPFPAKNTLKNGRTDLGGPLANVGGPWCPDGAPRLVVIAAHPSNNAGASGGRNTAPLPVTSLFNKLVFAIEIDYGGLVPMSKGQRKAATIFSRAGINVLKKSTDWIKAHADTSITGKWDPGYANGKTIDMGEFRQGVADFSAGTPTSEEDDMAQADIAEMQRKLSLLLAVPGTPRDPRERTPGQQVMETPIQLGDGQVTNFGSLWPELFGNSRAALIALAALRDGSVPDVDEKALAAALAPLITANLAKLSDADVARISEAVADEQARRQAA